ncbi:IS4 family transposase [Bacteroides rodentium]|uniref:IS4 family transposase n=1 Tax=Bacteroides rodentium TaxID=691816 RepID=UPI00046F5F40|nr:IS4 family transposase [Bacteroides rodentium]
MLKDKYVFAQLVSFLDRNKYNRIVAKYQGDKYIKSFTCWNQLLVMMFGQLANRESLRDLIVATEAHCGKLYHLGMGKSVTRSNLAKANETRDYRIFEEFAFYMIEQTRSKRKTEIFNLGGSVYAFDSTTIDLCLSVFDWAGFRKHKGGIKMHTLYDIETQVPAFVHITNASVHDSKAMPEIPYEPGAHYIFDRGYNDYGNLYKIDLIGGFFVVRAKTNVRFKPRIWKRRLKNGIKSDATGSFTVYKSSKDYPEELRKIVYVNPEDGKTYIFLTNNLDAPPELICKLYRNRWSVELFFKWIKQHLKIKRFWGTSENAVRIQIYCAIITYCLVAMVQHDMLLDRSVYEVLQIVGISLTDKTSLSDLFDKLNFKNVNDIYGSSGPSLFDCLTF